MSGGIAYVWDPENDFPKQCNTGTFELEPLASIDDILELKAMIKKHFLYTDSPVAKNILDNWEQSLRHFAKVMPTDYKRVLDNAV